MDEQYLPGPQQANLVEDGQKMPHIGDKTLDETLELMLSSENKALVAIAKQTKQDEWKKQQVGYEDSGYEVAYVDCTEWPD